MSDAAPAGAQIFEQGYQRYDGPRLGVWGSVRSLAVHSALRALGLRRTFWAKVLPIASVLIAYLPAAVFVGIAALVPTDQLDFDIIPEYAEYYGFISAAIVLFVAVVAPEVLCSDRRNGTLGLYLASPLTRETYLAAKVLAILPVLGLVTLGPPILLLVGRTLADAGPDNAGDFVLLLVRALASGVVVAAVYTSLSMAAASLTERRAVASAGVILVLLVSSSVTGILVEVLDVDRRLMLLNLFGIPFELVQRIYGQPGDEPSLETISLVAANLGWVLAGAALVVWRYRRITVAH